MFIGGRQFSIFLGEITEFIDRHITGPLIQIIGDLGDLVVGIYSVLGL
jgi:hypothetical protein